MTEEKIGAHPGAASPLPAGGQSPTEALVFKLREVLAGEPVADCLDATSRLLFEIVVWQLTANGLGRVAAKQTAGTVFGDLHDSLKRAGALTQEPTP